MGSSAPTHHVAALCQWQQFCTDTLSFDCTFPMLSKRQTYGKQATGGNTGMHSILTPFRSVDDISCLGDRKVGAAPSGIYLLSVCIAICRRQSGPLSLVKTARDSYTAPEGQLATTGFDVGPSVVMMARRRNKCSFFFFFFFFFSFCCCCCYCW